MSAARPLHANTALHATAFTMGEHVAFQAPPDLWLAAHEAAHVVQQRGGVSLSGGVGRAGDPYERQADTVADRVVSGRPAHDLFTGTRAAGRPTVQRCGGVIHEGCECAKEAGETADETSTAVQRNGDGGYLGALSSAVSEVASAAGEVAAGVESAAGEVAAGVESAASTVASAAGEVASDAESAVSSAAQAVAGTVSDVAADVEGAVSAGIKAVGTGIKAATSGVSAAVSWLETEAGKLALGLAGSLASRFGATVTVVGSEIHIDIPEIPLFSAHQSSPVELPGIVLPFPLVAAGGALGPVLFEGGLTAVLAAEPRADVILGPGSIRHITLVIDPLAGTGAATGQLHIAGSAAAALPIEAGIDAEGLIIILAGPVPIPIEADAFGGLRLTFQLSALGSLDETVGLAYSSGALTLGLQNQLSLGARLDARLDAAVEVHVEELTVCEYVWPLKTWPLGSVAEQFSFPLSVGYSSSGPSFSAGPASAKPIPIDKIEAVVPQWVAMQDCKSLDEIIAYLCKKGVLPPVACAPQPQGPSDLPAEACTPQPQGPSAFPDDPSAMPPDLPPFKNIFHHGTDYDTAERLGTVDIGAIGGNDFGRGFYTHSRENWVLAKEWAIRVSHGKQGWGVVTFPVPDNVWEEEIFEVMIFENPRYQPANIPINPDTGQKFKDWIEFVRYNKRFSRRRLPEWPELQVIVGPLWGRYQNDPRVRQVVFTSSGVPVLNRPESKAYRIVYVRLFCSRGAKGAP